MLIYSILVIQIVDILIHVLSNQIEPLRIIANLIIIIWVLAIKENKYDWPIVSIFLALNAVFLVQNGVLNEGEPRIFFSISILLTFILGLRYISTRK